MTEEHLTALLKASEAKKDAEGWHVMAEGRHVTLHVGFNGASLNVSRVQAMRHEGALLSARTTRGDVYVLAMQDVFAGALEPATSTNRKAGFV